MRRFLLFDHLDASLGEIMDADVFEATLRDVINGEHSLTITTTQVLDKGTRILYEDGRGYWHEYVVVGVDGEHASGNRVIGTYYCVWSLQHDLMGVPVSVMPGVQTPVNASTALQAILDATSRWSKGTVTNTNTGGASMYDTNCWDALSVLIANWSGEIDVTINVNSLTGIVSRAVDLYAQQGQSTPTRRFDFGSDLQSVTRTYADDPFYCRISPRGKGEQTEGGGYGRKITIESVNDGKDYLEYAPMVAIAKLPDGNGGYEYPTLRVENSSCETPADLKTWAQGVLADYCTPKISYSIDAVQSAVAGVDAQGVSLGDAVDIVDRKFGESGLRLTGRVTELTIDMLSERNVKVVIGNARESVSNQFAKLQGSINAITSWPSVAMGADVSMADYMTALLNSINAEINATGGYTYIVPGHGILTYDTAVTDPTVGAEASQVVEIKGGSIRIANTKTSGGDWEWKTVFTSGHIAADLVTAANITAGLIQDSTGESYWDLDNSLFKFTDNVLNEWDKHNHLEMGQVTFTEQSGWLNGRTSAQSATGLMLAGPHNGYYAYNGKLILIPSVYATRPTSSTGYYNSGSAILSRYTMRIMSNIDPLANPSGAYYRSAILLGDTFLSINRVKTLSGGVTPGIVLSDNHIDIGAKPSFTDGNYKISTVQKALSIYRSDYASDTGYGYGNSIDTHADISHFGGIDIYKSASGVSYSQPGINIGQSGSSYEVNVRIYGTFTASGTKSRLASTDNYGERLLYSYETPTPMFGDIGSGVIDSDGYCFVSIDDVFAETVRTDLSYQVFLQACGPGALYVESKASTHFVVRGEPGLAFDWEIKCRQAEYEHLRLDDEEAKNDFLNATNYGNDVQDAYGDEMEYIEQIERLYDEDIQAA